MKLISIKPKRQLKLFEFEWECLMCESVLISGLTNEDISVGDSEIICPNCKSRYYLTDSQCKNLVIKAKKIK